MSKVYRMEQVTVGPYMGRSPQFGDDVFLASGARIIGDIRIETGANIWFNVSARGDVHWIRIGAGTNIQDNSVLHVTTDRFPLDIGANVTVGHAAILHGCTVEDECLIGMGAILLDNCRIPKHSMVAAGALVAPGSTFPEGMLILGSPAKAVRLLRPEEIDFLIYSAPHYRDVARNYMKS